MVHSAWTIIAIMAVATGELAITTFMTTTLEVEAAAAAAAIGDQLVLVAIAATAVVITAITAFVSNSCGDTVVPANPATIYILIRASAYRSVLAWMKLTMSSAASTQMGAALDAARL